MPKIQNLEEFERKYGLTDAKGIYDLVGARAKGADIEEKFEEFATEVSNAVHMDLIAFEEKYKLPECIAEGVFKQIDTNHSETVTHTEYVEFVRKVKAADAAEIADTFLAITDRDGDKNVSKAEILALLSSSENNDKQLNSDVVKKLITVIFKPDKPEDPSPDSMTKEKFKAMIVKCKDGVKALKANMLATLGKPAAGRGPPRPGPSWCSNPEAGGSPAWMWHNWDGIFLHSALLGVFIYRYHHFYHGEGAEQHHVSIAKGAGLALLFGIFALYLTKLRMLQWLNCIPFWAKVLTVSRRTACSPSHKAPSSTARFLAFLSKPFDHARYSSFSQYLVPVCRNTLLTRVATLTWGLLLSIGRSSTQSHTWYVLMMPTAMRHILIFSAALKAGLRGPVSSSRLTVAHSQLLTLSGTDSNCAHCPRCSSCPVIFQILVI